jgi:hypothetical protein
METGEMNELKEVKAIVRNDSVPDLIQALKGAEITRFFVSRIHALGAGVEPEDYKLSVRRTPADLKRRGGSHDDDRRLARADADVARRRDVRGHALALVALLGRHSIGSTR